MAGCLLLIVLMCPLHDIEAQALRQPELMVHPLVITENDSVTLNCQTPSNVSAPQCDFYFETQERSGDCVQTLTGSDLLDKAHRRSPAEVKVRCFYTVMIDAISSVSSDSSTSVVTINNLHPPTLMVDQLEITETDSVTLNCQTPSSVSVTECYFIIRRGKPAKGFSCLKRLSGAELLSLTQQNIPAKVDVTCFYLLSHQSPPSDKFTITIQLPRPELTVNPLMITETGSVTLNCLTPSSVSVTECCLYFLRTKTTRTIPCVENLLGTELLMTAHQSSPADVELMCYYNVEQRGDKYQSPLSYIASIRIQTPLSPSALPGSAEGEQCPGLYLDVVETSTSTVSAVNSTTDFTVSTPPSTLFSASMTSVELTSDLSVGTANTVSSLSTSLASVKPASVETSTDTLTSEFPETSLAPTTETEQKFIYGTEQWKLMFVVGPAFGVTVGVVLMVVALLCSRGRSGKRTRNRSQAKFAGDLMRMRNFDAGRWLSADNDEANTMTHLVPAADSSNGFVQVSRPKSQSENPDIYHVYATIPDEPAASALMDITYSTVQAH